VLDLRTETVVPLSVASRHIPPARSGRETRTSTLQRWITHGARGPSGQRVFLEGLRLGARWLTSLEALQRFADALTPMPANLAPVTAQAANRPIARRRAAERAGQELDRLGI
jgi:hypothetical protein